MNKQKLSLYDETPLCEALSNTRDYSRFDPFHCNICDKLVITFNF